MTDSLQSSQMVFVTKGMKVDSLTAKGSLCQESTVAFDRVLSGFCSQHAIHEINEAIYCAEPSLLSVARWTFPRHVGKN